MAQAAAKTTPKKPTDRKKKDEEVTITRPEETPGWHLLKSFADVPVWDQTPLVAMLDDAFSDSTTEMSKEEYAKLTPEERQELKEGTRRSFDVNIVGQLAKELIKFAVDEQEYTKFVSGSGAMERAMTLAMAWVGQMGEASSSEDS